MPRQSDVRYTFEPLKGDAFDVVSFKLKEGLSQPFKLELDLASHNAAIDFNRVLDLAGLFTIWRGETPVRYVHGMVSLFTQADTGFRRTRYSVVLEPTLKRFELRSNWHIFQGKNVPDIRIGGNVEHYVKSHYRLAAGEGIAQKTTVFEVAADERIVLKAPGGSITIDGDGITLDGLTIKIKEPVTVDTIGSGNPFASQRRSPIPPPGDFPGRYTLLKSDQLAFAGYRYRITDGAAVIAAGLTQSSGETDWAMTQTTHAVQAHKAIVREDQRVTETSRPHIALIEEQAVAHDDAGVFPDNFLDQYLGDLD